MEPSDNLPKQRVMPTLRITDYLRSKMFYVESLGFHIDWEHRFKPEFPVFMQVSRDGLAFFLTAHAGDCPWEGWFISTFLTSMRGLPSFRARGFRLRRLQTRVFKGCAA